MLATGTSTLLTAAWTPIHVAFPGGRQAAEEIFLRWVHFLAGITWIGLLYFFNLAATPVMKRLDMDTRGKIVAGLMPRTLWLFRWSALVTVLAGLWYFMILLQQDAVNAGNPSLEWTWLWHWFLVWTVAYALIHGLMMPVSGPMSRKWVRAPLITIVVAAASWIILDWNNGPGASNASLAIAVGGGLGWVMLNIVWGFVWRAQKKLIRWTQAHEKDGTPMPAEAAVLQKRAQTGSRVGFWLSIPMLFFMGAAAHYPFLS